MEGGREGGRRERAEDDQDGDKWTWRNREARKRRFWGIRREPRLKISLVDANMFWTIWFWWII